MKLKILAALVCGAVLAAHSSGAAVKTKIVEYKQGDTALEGMLAWDDSIQGKRPGVLVLHQYFGVTPFEKDIAGKLARMGYVAFVADIYGKGVHPGNPKEAVSTMMKYVMDRPLWRARDKAALDVLLAAPHVDKSRIASIGFCFGGGSVLELARSGAPIVANVIFHGTLATPTPEDAKNIKGRVLALQGGDDPVVPQKDVDAFEAEMRNAHVDWQLVQYGGTVHAYMMKEAGNDNSKGAAYNAESAKRAWVAMRDFFKETLKQ